MSKLADNSNFFNLYLNFLENIIGNYSIAFQVRNENKIVISSNCGSLYYYFDGVFFSFASERKILIDFLKKSKLFKNKSFDQNRISKCLNQTIIYNKEGNNLISYDHTKKNFTENKILINLKSNLEILNNFTFTQTKLKNLKM